MRYFLSGSLALLAAICMSSCEKKEHAVVLPLRGAATYAQVDMGEDYQTQFYYSLVDSAIVSASDHACWDISFEAAPNAGHLFMNGGIGMELYRLQDTDFAAVTALPAGLTTADLRYDAASGIPDSSAAGNWQAGGSYSPLYIIRSGGAPPYNYQKLRIISMSAQEYKIEYGALASHTATVLALHKDSSYNFSYLKFAAGALMPEPAKSKWDLLFTRYQAAIWDDQVAGYVPYPVTGVLLNPYHTTAALDTVHTFDSVTAATAGSLTFSASRDVIGYNWKSYSTIGSTGGTYSVNSKLIYLIRTQGGQLYKLHFLGFYNSAGVKGSPGFEFTRLQ